jgi:hypothetical protein
MPRLKILAFIYGFFKDALGKAEQTVTDGRTDGEEGKFLP